MAQKTSDNEAECRHGPKNLLSKHRIEKNKLQVACWRNCTFEMQMLALWCNRRHIELFCLRQIQWIFSFDFIFCVRIVCNYTIRASRPSWTSSMFCNRIHWLTFQLDIYIDSISNITRILIFWFPPFNEPNMHRFYAHCIVGAIIHDRANNKTINTKKIHWKLLNKKLPFLSLKQYYNLYSAHSLSVSHTHKHTQCTREK